MSVQFEVDDVKPATDALPTRPLAEALGDALSFGGDGDSQVVDHGPTHALLGAVHLAFASHRPLVLSPDVLWLTVAEGFAQHVRANAAALRSRLVSHEGKARIEVFWDGPMPTSPEDWTTAVEMFRGALARKIGEGRARLLECDFSTTGDVERTASQVVLMDAYSPYFDYFMMCICGIPNITLLGTADDWRKIRQRIDVLEEFDCGFWTRSLAPIFDEFVAAAEGRADPEFWKRIYKPVDAYGGAVITGWIARLYPYLKRDLVNPLLALPLSEPSGVTSAGQPWYSGPGISTDSVQSGPSRASIDVIESVDGVTGKRRTVVLEAGVRAVEQSEDLSLTPICAWTLRDGGTLNDVIERLKRDPRVTLHAPKETSAEDDLHISGAAEFFEFYAAVGTLQLFDGEHRWSFQERNAPAPIDMASGDMRYFLKLVADLPNEGFLATVEGTSPPIIVHCQKSRVKTTEVDHGWEGSRRTRRSLRGNLEDLPIVAESLASLLTLALDAGPGAQLPVLRTLGEWMKERAGD